MRWVEHAASLDIRFLNRSGVLQRGGSSVVSWTDQAGERNDIGCSIEADLLRLSYRVRWVGESDWTAVDEQVCINWTNPHLGGRRSWFSCPGCDHRVALLYLGATRFRCRTCLGLHYRSQDQTRADRLLSKAQRIRTDLGGTGNLFAVFPAKPKGMHWRTYRRLRSTAQDATHQSLVAALGRFAR